jgi:hypothetical protein
MAFIRYRPDLRGTNELMRSAGMEALMREHAQRGKAFAEGIAPRHTGDYAASFRVTSTRSGGPRHNRATAYLYNDSPHAIYVEVKDGYHVLARAADVIRGGL